MGWTRPLLGALTALHLLGMAPGAFAKDLHGVALVVGESSYANLPALANPANDEKAMAELFGDLGFDVTTAQTPTTRSCSGRSSGEAAGGSGFVSCPLSGTTHHVACDISGHHA